MANTAAKRYGSGRFVSSTQGDTYVDIYRVPKNLAANAYQAAFAPGIPRKYDPLVIENFPVPKLYAKEIITDPESDSVANVWTVSVTYGELSGPVHFPSLTPTVRWSLGLQSTRSEVSMTGKLVGSHFGYNTGGASTPNPKIRDPNAEIGYDRLSPTMEFNIRVPQTTLWDPINIGNIRGCVNDSIVTLQGKAFAIGTILFAGADAEPIGPSHLNYEVNLSFIAGFRIIQDTLPMFIEQTFQPWTGGRILPIKYDVWPRFKLTAEVQPNGAIEITTREVVAWSVYQAYPTANFLSLRL